MADGFVSEFERKTAALAALDGVPTALCMNNMLIGGNEADPCTGIIGFTPGVRDIPHPSSSLSIPTRQ